MKFVDLQSHIETAERILAEASDRDPAERFAREVVCEIKFRAGTYQMRHCGAIGSCTAGGRGLLLSWIKAARKRLEKGGAS